MKGIIFDMDGTMVDNMMVHHRAWQRNMASHGIEMSLEEIMEKVHGINEEILERLFGDRFSPDERITIGKKKESIYREIFAPDLKLIGGLEELLNEVKEAGIPMAIGTAAPRENVDFVMDQLMLRPYFQSVMDAQSVTKGKPDPEIFISSAESIGVPVDSCIIFEDSVTGATASERAGAPTIILTTTHQEKDFNQFDHIIDFIPDYRSVTLEYLSDKAKR